MSDSRLGAPVELPWWVIPLGIPPVVTVVLGTLMSAPPWARLLVLLTSLALLAVLLTVATRIASRNMQSVWISAAYAVWVFAAVLWVVAVASPGCNCA
ncbi:MAG: hypothetical protein M3019_09495 [Candidatus Dormibacteraeota bacterium]|nr:hypothetical protein [Candidatus Dormibacteraeota bacterium]